jgi:hypothetical protein
VKYLLALPLHRVADMINAINGYNETPLHLAAGAGLDGVVHLLMNIGADPCLLDKYGRSPSTVSAAQLKCLITIYIAVSLIFVVTYVCCVLYSDYLCMMGAGGEAKRLPQLCHIHHITHDTQSAESIR